MHIVVVANGELPETFDPVLLRSELEAADLVIAADGGLVHCQTLGVVPDLVVGDLDSTSATAVERATRQGVAVQKFATDKDATDLDLAIDEAIERGADRLSVVAGFGGRLDHELATIGLLGSDRIAMLRVDAWDGRRRLWILRPGFDLDLELEAGTTVSIVPLGGAIAGATTTGLKWALDGDELALGSTRGVSNVVDAPRQTMTLTAGVAAVIVDPS